MKWAFVAFGLIVATTASLAQERTVEGSAKITAPMGVVTPEEIARAVEAEARTRPEALLGLAVASFAERRVHEEALRSAVMDQFAVLLAGMKHCPWLGDVKSDRTAFALVDYSSPFAGRFLIAVRDFAAKADVRVAVLPASLIASDGAGRAAAFAAGAAAAGKFGRLSERLMGPKATYGGSPEILVDPGDVAAIEAAAKEQEAMEIVASVRTLGVALEQPQPMGLWMESRRYVGSLENGDEMAAFFAPQPSKAFVDEALKRTRESEAAEKARPPAHP